MNNPFRSISAWFFELIEDAVGKETMKKYKQEMDKKSKIKEKDA